MGKWPAMGEEEYARVENKKESSPNTKDGEAS
jgi:hypothetical protein